MVDDFNITTQMLLDRIRVLEQEKCGSDSRPQTAAILERVDSTWGAKLASQRPRHEPEVLTIEEETPTDLESPQKVLSSQGGDAAADADKECGNCGQHISAAKFTLHSVYCYRDNFHCSVCEKVLP